MDSEKFAYFLSKYRSADDEELRALGARIDSLADEAQEALSRTLRERGLSPPPEQRPETPKAEQPDSQSDAATYSRTGLEIIQIRKRWFLWSIPLAFAAGFVYGNMAESARGSPIGVLAALFGLFAFIWPLYCLYKLSRALDPKRSVAWIMVIVQFIPILGWIAAISLVLKAHRITKNLDNNTISEA